MTEIKTSADNGVAMISDKAGDKLSSGAISRMAEFSYWAGGCAVKGEEYFVENLSRLDSLSALEIAAFSSFVYSGGLVYGRDTKDYARFLNWLAGEAWMLEDGCRRPAAVDAWREWKTARCRAGGSAVSAAQPRAPVKVSLDAVVRRLNRTLAKDGKQLHKARGNPFDDGWPGPYFVTGLDIERTVICVEQDGIGVNGVERLARRSGALQSWEEMTR
jgi:hypothetical protein